MRFIVGGAVGLVLGLAASASADKVGGWVTGAQVMDSSQAFRVGYAAGADDMLKAVVALEIEQKAKGNLQQAAFWFVKANACLEGRRGGSLGQFTEFVETLWRGRNSQAASVLLDQACP
jgi:hypothetical protein